MTLQELQREVLELPMSDLLAAALRYRAVLAQVLLESLRRENYPVREHPLARFAGIINDAEAIALQEVIKTEFVQVDEREW